MGLVLFDWKINKKMQFTTYNYTIHNMLEKMAFFYDILLVGCLTERSFQVTGHGVNSNVFGDTLGEIGREGAVHFIEK